MRCLIRELRACRAKDPRHDTVQHERMRDVMHHVADEETVLLPLAEGRQHREEHGSGLFRRHHADRPRPGRVVAARMVSRRTPEVSVAHQNYQARR